MYVVHCPTEPWGDLFVQGSILGEKALVEPHVDLDFRLQEGKERFVSADDAKSWCVPFVPFIQYVHRPWLVEGEMMLPCPLLLGWKSP